MTRFHSSGLSAQLFSTDVHDYANPRLHFCGARKVRHKWKVQAIVHVIATSDHASSDQAHAVDHADIDLARSLDFRDRCVVRAL